jgi:type IV secretion system protein VirB1
LESVAAQSGPSPEPVKHRISADLLARLIGSCAAEINPRTQAAIVAVESGGDAWAVRDDNDGSHYSPDSFDDAVAIEHVLRERDRGVYAAADRGIDVGLAQINSSNFAALRVDAATMFDPCDNLRASAKIFAAAYSHARAALGAGSGADADQLALQQALQVYNSGKGSGDEAYVRAILATLDTPFVRTIAPGMPSAGPQTIAQQSSAAAFPPASDDPRPTGPDVAAGRAPAPAPDYVAVKGSEDGVPLERSAVFVHVDASAAVQAAGPIAVRPRDKARE